MNGAHLHLIINHFPIVGSIIGAIILLIGMSKQNKILIQTGQICFIIIGLLTFPAYFSGEGAEEIVEAIPSVEESYIEHHEEHAKVGLILSIITGIIASISLYLTIKRPIKARLFNLLLLILSIGLVVAMILVGNSGGQIRHTEIRDTYKAPIEIEHHDDHDE